MTSVIRQSGPPTLPRHAASAATMVHMTTTATATATPVVGFEQVSKTYGTSGPWTG